MFAFRWIAAGWLLFAIVSSTSVAADAYIVRDGEPMAEILISERPPRMVKLAAEEMQTYIRKITGATLPIVTQPGADGAVRIYIGRSVYTDKLGITDEGLKHGAFRMVSGENRLVLLGQDSDFTPTQPYMRNGASHEVARAIKEWDLLTGKKWGFPFNQVHKRYSRELNIWEKDRRGSLNAVYAFLRMHGVRWYLPDELGEIVPTTSTIKLPQIDKTVRPDFALRYPYQYARMFGYGMTTRDEVLWQLRMGFSQAPDLIGEMEMSLNHGICYVNCRDEVRAAHPEYFMMINQKREIYHHGLDRPGLANDVADVGRPCLSSQGLFEANVEYARAMFDLLDVPMVSIMPQDGYGSICECELCAGQGKDTPERGWSGQISDYVWGYVNRVAAEVYKTHPDKKVTCLAYSTYKLPPTQIDKLSPNLMVGLAQNRRRYLAPDKHYADLRKQWLDKLPGGSKQLWIWEYYLYGSPRSRNKFLPVVFPHSIARDLRSLKDVSIGEFVEFYRPGKAGISEMATSHLNLYITARLWWDADQDVDQLLEEYYTLYYGPARAQMKTFFEYAEDNWRDMVKKPEKIGKVFELLGQAQQATSAGSVYGRRIALIADYIKPLQRLGEQHAKGRQKTKFARTIDRENVAFTLDGRLDEKVWSWQEVYHLSELETGRKPACSTTFKTFWANDSLYIAIQCNDFDMTSISRRKGKQDDTSIWNGDCVEILLETQSHAYYQIAISPGGTVVDLDRQDGLNTLWSSGAQVATHIGERSWSVEIRLPLAAANQDELDSLNGIAATKPNETYPWYLNICRQRIRTNGNEFSAFSPTGKSDFHHPLKFAEFWVK